MKDTDKLDTLRIGNASEALATSIFLPLCALFFILIGVVLLAAEQAGGVPFFELIPILIGIAFLYWFYKSNLVYALQLGESFDVTFVMRKNKSYAYDEIQSIKLSTQTTKLMGVIVIKRDLYINIEMQDGLSFRLRTNQRELDKIKSILTSKGLVEAIDAKIGESPSEWLFLPPSFLDG